MGTRTIRQAWPAPGDANQVNGGPDELASQAVIAVAISLVLGSLWLSMYRGPPPSSIDFAAGTTPLVTEP